MKANRVRKSQRKGKPSERKKAPSYFKCETCLGFFSMAQKPEHVCVQPTEATVLANLEDDPRDAWRKLRAFAVSLGEQRIYCSSKAIMFAREICYMFVRAKKSRLELYLMLDQTIKDPLVKKVEQYSKTRFRHRFDIHHEDMIEEPLTDWILSAWDLATRKQKNSLIDSPRI